MKRVLRASRQCAPVPTDKALTFTRISAGGPGSAVHAHGRSSVSEATARCVESEAYVVARRSMETLRFHRRQVTENNSH